MNRDEIIADICNYEIQIKLLENKKAKVIAEHNNEIRQIMASIKDITKLLNEKEFMLNGNFSDQKT